MTLEEAKTEATRRWGVWGGWAAVQSEEVWNEKKLHFVTVDWRVVGIRLSTPGGAEKRVLARGATFEEAFELAEIGLQKAAERKPPARRKPHPRALPQENLFVDPPKMR
jgi:hypothetical protein